MSVNEDVRSVCSVGEATFALVADGEDVDAVVFGQVAIQGDIAGAALRDDEFAQVVRGGATDQRVAL